MIKLVPLKSRKDRRKKTDESLVNYVFVLNLKYNERWATVYACITPELLTDSPQDVVAGRLKDHFKVEFAKFFAMQHLDLLGDDSENTVHLHVSRAFRRLGRETIVDDGRVETTYAFFLKEPERVIAAARQLTSDAYG